MTNHSARANGHISLDYHLHSNVSCDTSVTMAEMCGAALALGMSEIAFTEHFDLHPLDYCVNFYKPDDYFEKLENVRRVFAPQGLTIRAGVEVGEYHLYHDTAKPVLDAWPYDLVLGSLHWVGNDSIFDPAYFSGHTPQTTIAPYFTELLALVRFGGFDVLSHPDVFKRVAYAVYGQYDAGEWEDLIRPVWQACIEQGIGIEVNTASLRREIGQVHPSLDALRWYREMGGDRLTFGSDGHQPDHVAYGFATARDVARAAGFTRVCCFERRQVVRWIEI
jgi:histidinol-phosphatase (PHP family)